MGRILRAIGRGLSRGARAFDRAKHRTDRVLDPAAVYSIGNMGYFLGAYHIVDIATKGSELLARGAMRFQEHETARHIADFFGETVVDYLQDNPEGFQTAAVLGAGAGIYAFNRYVLGGVTNQLQRWRRTRTNSGWPGWAKTAGLAGLLTLATWGSWQAVRPSYFGSTEQRTARGYDVFEYHGRAQNPRTIADLFDRWDEKQGDHCKNVGTMNVFQGEDGGWYIKAGCGSQEETPIVMKGDCQNRYVPSSDAAVALFEQAAVLAGVPVEWAESPALHEILKRESDGWVGIPNYTIRTKEGEIAQTHPETWAQIHEDMKNGRWKRYRARSSGTGLGQLLLSNVDRHYPSGRAGIGNCLEEAAGMLAYIQERHGHPSTALRNYGKRHEGY